ncbi:protein S100-A13 isoform X1 [Sciurus carolinensis]|uniref:protein S100-A13 isoform X1 n=1 Tax=Sciurus carolinensis TaxID=30640 RepID=UPI001FB1F39C|nr:protein S100-A13 isoform X1 [Sciurus carolinensis]
MSPSSAFCRAPRGSECPDRALVGSENQKNPVPGPCQLETGLGGCVGSWSQHSVQLRQRRGREGRKGSLSINEFKELATQQLPHLLKDVGSLDEKMKSLDVNQDTELKFNEYWRLIGELAKEIRKEKALEIRKK